MLGQSNNFQEELTKIEDTITICDLGQATDTDPGYQPPSPQEAHDFWKEKAVIVFLATVVCAGFIANIVVYLSPREEDKLSAFAANSSNTALGALVAVLAGRSGVFSQEE